MKIYIPPFLGKVTKGQKYYFYKIDKRIINNVTHELIMLYDYFIER